jgi:hypothetical protein
MALFCGVIGHPEGEVFFVGGRLETLGISRWWVLWNPGTREGVLWFGALVSGIAVDKYMEGFCQSPRAALSGRGKGVWEPGGVELKQEKVEEILYGVSFSSFLSM